MCPKFCLFSPKKTHMGLVRIGGAAMHHLRLAGLIVNDDGTVPGPPMAMA